GGVVASTANDERRELELPRKKVVIVTANIALQEQLVTKDLPKLRELLPWPFDFKIAKGLSNYLCLDRYDEAAATLLMDPLVDEVERDQWSKVERWSAETTRGDFSELPFEPLPRVRSLVTIPHDDCTGSACARASDCFSRKAKKELDSADIIATNYHLFFIDLVVRRNSENEASVLPNYDLAIFDEGHKAADIARDFFGYDVKPGTISYCARMLAPKNTPEAFAPDARPRVEARDRRSGEALQKQARLLRRAQREAQAHEAEPTRPRAHRTPDAESGEGLR
ncbi:MAG: hypothetical protein HC882_07025, partial [Acidobacteria bacterium]|nr:hypothetical protein [Acidobacteriota bacterium]